jgi:hypothetical protein
MSLIFAKYLMPTRFDELTAFPYIFIKSHQDKDFFIFVNHEKINLSQ